MKEGYRMVTLEYRVLAYQECLFRGCSKGYRCLHQQMPPPRKILIITSCRRNRFFTNFSPIFCGNFSQKTSAPRTGNLNEARFKGHRM